LPPARGGWRGSPVAKVALSGHRLGVVEPRCQDIVADFAKARVTARSDARQPVAVCAGVA
jgi:hypothetical protein